jgi:putative endonuclease
MPDRRSQGRDAEDQAADFLLSQGLTMVTRRFKCRAGELDLIALDGDTLAFIEVKQRLTPGSRPEESVSKRKRELLHQSAREYLRKMGEPERPYRFDLVAIDRDGIRHYPGALTDSWEN